MMLRTKLMKFPMMRFKMTSPKMILLSNPIVVTQRTLLKMMQQQTLKVRVDPIYRMIPNRKPPLNPRVKTQRTLLKMMRQQTLKVRKKPICRMIPEKKMTT